MGALVFVVEDATDLREVCVFALQSAGFEARGFTTGANLLMDLEAGSAPAAVLVDLGLEDMNGVELIVRARQTPGNAGLRVILASGREGLGAIALEVQAQGWLRKPYDLATLFDEVERVIA